MAVELYFLNQNLFIVPGTSIGSPPSVLQGRNSSTYGSRRTNYNRFQNQNFQNNGQGKASSSYFIPSTTENTVAFASKSSLFNPPPNNIPQSSSIHQENSVNQFSDREGKSLKLNGDTIINQFTGSSEDSRKFQTQSQQQEIKNIELSEPLPNAQTQLDRPGPNVILQLEEHLTDMVNNLVELKKDVDSSKASLNVAVKTKNLPARLELEQKQKEMVMLEKHIESVMSELSGIKDESQRNQKLPALGVLPAESLKQTQQPKVIKKSKDEETLDLEKNIIEMMEKISDLQRENNEPPKQPKQNFQNIKVESQQILGHSKSHNEKPNISELQENVLNMMNALAKLKNEENPSEKAQDLSTFIQQNNEPSSSLNPQNLFLKSEPLNLGVPLKNEESANQNTLQLIDVEDLPEEPKFINPEEGFHLPQLMVELADQLSQKKKKTNEPNENLQLEHVMVQMAHHISQIQKDEPVTTKLVNVDQLRNPITFNQKTDTNRQNKALKLDMDEIINKVKLLQEEKQQKIVNHQVSDSTPQNELTKSEEFLSDMSDILKELSSTQETNILNEEPKLSHENSEVKFQGKKVDIQKQVQNLEQNVEQMMEQLGLTNSEEGQHEIRKNAPTSTTTVGRTPRVKNFDDTSKIMNEIQDISEKISELDLLEKQHKSINIDEKQTETKIQVKQIQDRVNEMLNKLSEVNKNGDQILLKQKPENTHEDNLLQTQNEFISDNDLPAIAQHRFHILDQLTSSPQNFINKEPVSDEINQKESSSKEMKDLENHIKEMQKQLEILQNQENSKSSVVPDSNPKETLLDDSTSEADKHKSSDLLLTTVPELHQLMAEMKEQLSQVIQAQKNPEEKTKSSLEVPNRVKETQSNSLSSVLNSESRSNSQLKNLDNSSQVTTLNPTVLRGTRKFDPNNIILADRPVAKDKRTLSQSNINFNQFTPDPYGLKLVLAVSTMSPISVDSEIDPSSLQLQRSTLQAPPIRPRSSNNPDSYFAYWAQQRRRRNKERRRLQG